MDARFPEGKSDQSLERFPFKCRQSIFAVIPAKAGIHGPFLGHTPHGFPLSRE